MNDTSMTDASRFTLMDADRVLRRAAEIEGADEGSRLTVAELRLIAGEAGFGREAVERAIAEIRAREPAETPRPAVRRSGFFVTRLVTVRQIPVTVDSEQLLRAVRLFHPYREGAAQVKLEDHLLTWRDGRGLRFTVTAVDGGTQVRVAVAKPLLRRGRWMGWVRAAADRLEALITLVAREDGGGAE